MSIHAVMYSSYCFHVSFKTLLSTCWLYYSKTNGSRSRVKVLCFSSWGGFSPSTGIAFVANTVDVASFDEVVVCDASFLVEVVAEALKLDISEAAYDDYMTMACNAASPFPAFLDSYRVRRRSTTFIFQSWFFLIQSTNAFADFGSKNCFVWKSKSMQ